MNTKALEQKTLSECTFQDSSWVGVTSIEGTELYIVEDSYTSVQVFSCSGAASLYYSRRLLEMAALSMD